VSTFACSGARRAYQIKDRHLHHALVEVSSTVLDDLDGDHLLCSEVLALDHLTEGALSKHIEDQVTILVARFLRPQNVVDIEDVVAVLIVVAVVLDTFARLGEDAAWIARGLVVESAIAELVRCGQMGRQRLQGLEWVWSARACSCVQDKRPTLMKPPSGLARRNGGWALILGFSSAVLVHFSNVGTGPRPMAGS